MAPKVKGIKNSKKQTKTLQRPVLKHPKSSFYVALLLLELKDDCRTLGGAPIAL
jgi:hypothetical protein